MGSNVDVEGAPSHHEHHSKRDGRNDGPRELSESSRRGANYRANNHDVGDETHENGSPKQELGEQSSHDCKIVRGMEDNTKADDSARFGQSAKSFRECCARPSILTHA